jgi:O-acetyl-ADP-ribose deacetylase (regulator of RNase III)
MARIELWNGDICDLEVDAIVSPAATSLWMSTGIAGEIKRAGGDAVEFAALRQAPVALGDAIVTPAGNLAARVIIHAVSLERDRRTNGQAIDQAARNAMARARELNLGSIAFPALGTGIGGFPLEEAARIAVSAVRDELPTSPSVEHVIFALRGAAAYEAFARALSDGEPAPSRPLVQPEPWQSVGPGRAARVGAEPRPAEPRAADGVAPEPTVPDDAPAGTDEQAS